MQDLNVVEIDEVNGGIWQFVAGVAAGVAGNYVYESLGGKAGIERRMQDVLDWAYFND